jgi:hypothetical protein
MVRQRRATAQELLRLDAMAKHLKIRSRYLDPTFPADVVTAGLARIAPIVDRLLPCTGEQISVALAEHLCLTFEEVHGPHDVEKLMDHYFKGKKEIGFAQLPGELDQPGVDALLFQRMHAGESAPDRWVAVLNLQESTAKAYWNRFHELAHRIAEPPQKILPLARQKFEVTNPLEAIIDLVAAEFAFYGPAFCPLVQRAAKRERLDFDIVDAIQSAYAPSASLLSTIKAVVKYWPRPAVALTAEFRGRRAAPDIDQALRVQPQGYNHAASVARLSLFPNMRVPTGTPIDRAFQSGVTQNRPEHLSEWGTSDGRRLANLDVHTSAKRIGSRVYALMSL